MAAREPRCLAQPSAAERAPARMASCRASSDGRFCSTTATDGSAASRRVPSPASTAESVWRFSRSTIPPRPLSSRRCHRRSATPPGISSGRTAASGHGVPPASTSSPALAGATSPRPRRGSSGRSTLSTSSLPTIGIGSVHSSPTARRLAGFRDAGAGPATRRRGGSLSVLAGMSWSLPRCHRVAVPAFRDRGHGHGARDQAKALAEC